MERQAHGFNFEQKIFQTYGVKPSNNYTAKWDGTLNNVPVSIKTAKYGTDIEMADFFRQAEIIEDFYLFVGFQKGNKNNIVEQHLLKISGENYHNYFDISFIEPLYNLLSIITNDKTDDEKWKKEILYFRNLWEEKTPNLIRLRFKRDHKNQKRIQCAINNKDFYKYFLSQYEVKNE